MALSPRQRELYTDRVNIWKPVNVADAPTTYTLLYSSVPCKIQETPNVDDPDSVAGLKRETFFTTDIINLPIVDDNGRTLKIPNGCFFTNVTPNNPNRGTVQISEGAPNLLPGAGVRNLNVQRVNVMTADQPPQEVLAGL